MFTYLLTYFLTRSWFNYVRSAEHRLDKVSRWESEEHMTSKWLICTIMSSGILCAGRPKVITYRLYVAWVTLRLLHQYLEWKSIRAVVGWGRGGAALPHFFSRKDAILVPSVHPLLLGTPSLLFLGLLTPLKSIYKIFIRQLVVHQILMTRSKYNATQQKQI